MPRLTGVEDAQKYWDGTIVSYRGEPFYCSLEDTKFYLKPFKDGVIQAKAHFLSIDHDPFLLSYPDVGYVNEVDGSVLYLQRATYRQWKFGLCGGNTIVRFNGSEKDNTTSTAKLLRTPYVQCYKNEYPSLEEALQKKSCAFSRHYAVQQGGLYYKTILVGKVSPKADCLLQSEYYNTLTVLDLKDMGMRSVIEEIPNGNENRF